MDCDPFNKCDDFVFAQILALTGLDIITRINLRGVCRRWRELVELPRTEDQTICDTIYESAKDERLFMEVMVPTVSRIMREPRFVRVREQLHKNRVTILRKSSRAPNSRMFRAIWSMLWPACEKHPPNMLLKCNMLRWSDIEEICATYCCEHGVPGLDVMHCANSVTSFGGMDVLCQDILHVMMSNNMQYGLSSHTDIYNWYHDLIIRQLFMGGDRNRRSLLLTLYYDQLADLIDAQDIALMNGAMHSFTNTILEIYKVYRGQIPRDILDALFAQCNAKIYWRNLFYKYPIDAIEPVLREKLETLFAQPIGEIAANIILKSYDREYLPKWRCIVALRKCTSIASRVSDGTISDAICRKYCVAGYILNSIEVVNAFHIIEHLVNVRYDPQFIVRIVANLGVPTIALRQIIYGLAYSNLDTRRSRVYARLLARIVLDYEHSYRVPISGHMIQEAKSNPTLRELYDKMGYV